MTLTLRPSELASIRAGLEAQLKSPVECRHADFADPINPRRLQMVLAQLPAEPVLGTNREITKTNPITTAASTP